HDAGDAGMDAGGYLATTDPAFGEIDVVGFAYVGAVDEDMVGGRLEGGDVRGNASGAGLGGQTHLATAVGAEIDADALDPTHEAHPLHLGDFVFGEFARAGSSVLAEDALVGHPDVVQRRAVSLIE